MNASFNATSDSIISATIDEPSYYDTFRSWFGKPTNLIQKNQELDILLKQQFVLQETKAMLSNVKRIHVAVVEQVQLYTQEIDNSLAALHAWETCLDTLDSLPVSLDPSVKPDESCNSLAQPLSLFFFRPTSRRESHLNQVLADFYFNYIYSLRLIAGNRSCGEEVCAFNWRHEGA